MKGKIMKIPTRWAVFGAIIGSLLMLAFGLTINHLAKQQGYEEGFRAGQASMPRYDWDWYRAEVAKIAEGVILDVPWVDVRFTEDGPDLGEVHVGMTEYIHIKYPGAITMDLENVKRNIDPTLFPDNCIVREHWVTCSNIAGHWAGGGTLHFDVRNDVPPSERPANWRVLR